MIVLPNKVYCASFTHSTGKEQAQAAARMGHAERDIFIEGRGAENFSACLAAIRGPGTLGLYGGLRVLGSSRKEVMDKLRIIRERHIRPYNIKTGVCDIADLLDEAIVRINAHRAIGDDRGRPKRMGRRGGQMKGVRAQEHRDSVMTEGVVQRLCAHPKLSWEDCAAILGNPPFSATTLRRKYGPQVRN